MQWPGRAGLGPVGLTASGLKGALRSIAAPLCLVRRSRNSLLELRAVSLTAGQFRHGKCFPSVR